MISAPLGMRVYLACGATEMRNGVDGLAMVVQQVLPEDPFGGAVHAFRGRYPRARRLDEALWPHALRRPAPSRGAGCPKRLPAG